MGIGVWQVVLILVIVLVIFGAGKLPKVMGDVAKGVKNFKSEMKDASNEEKPAIDAKEEVNEEAKAAPVQTTEQKKDAS